MEALLLLENPNFSPPELRRPAEIALYFPAGSFDFAAVSVRPQEHVVVPSPADALQPARVRPLQFHLRRGGPPPLRSRRVPLRYTVVPPRSPLAVVVRVPFRFLRVCLGVIVSDDHPAREFCVRRRAGVWQDCGGRRGLPAHHVWGRRK